MVTWVKDRNNANIVLVCHVVWLCTIIWKVETYAGKYQSAILRAVFHEKLLLSIQVTYQQNVIKLASKVVQIVQRCPKFSIFSYLPDSKCPWRESSMWQIGAGCTQDRSSKGNHPRENSPSIHF